MNGENIGDAESTDYLGMVVNGQMFGIPIHRVFDILDSRPLARVPLSAPAVRGLINLRGRIVTAIDVRECLGLEPGGGDDEIMHVVIYREEEPYSLVVDKVTEAWTLKHADRDPVPMTLDERWRSVSEGVHRIEDGDEHKLMLMIDVDRLIDIDALRGR